MEKSLVDVGKSPEAREQYSIVCEVAENDNIDNELRPIGIPAARTRFPTAVRVVGVLIVAAVAAVVFITLGPKHDTVDVGNHVADAIGLRSVRPTVFNPDPSKIKWSTKPEKGKAVLGDLFVPLDPHDPDSPQITLQIQMVLAAQQPSRGTLFMHSGGPGSDHTAATVGGVLFPPFDVVAISQRGIGPAASPKFKCEGHSKLPTYSMMKTYAISDFTNCPCAAPDGTPEWGETWADVNPTDADEVHQFMKHVEAWGMKCYNSSKFQLKGKKGKTYNFLNYVGTQMLAHDLEQLRLAIGAASLDIFGMSYGTYVGAVYATLYPNSARRVVLDGNMMPMPQKLDLANGCAKSLQKVEAELILNCKRNENSCMLKDPEANYEKVMSLAEQGELVAWTKRGEPFALKLGMLHGYLQSKLGAGAAAWPSALKIIKSLASGNDEIVSKAVEEILDYMCVVKNQPTWSTYGICVGAGQTMEDEAHHGGTVSPFIDGIAVLGGELAGRYLANDAYRAWNSAAVKYSSAGLSAFLGLAGQLLWPSVPAPNAPVGNAETKALVVGNLYDPATSYYWSQGMTKAFPDGAMMTWQGVGHLFITSVVAGDPESMACWVLIQKYLMTGVLPRDGRICRKTLPVASN